MKRHILTVLMTFLAAVLSGVTFVVALFHQFALVEVAASILTGLQVFFLSSSIGDLLEDKKEANLARDAASIISVLFLAAFYLITRYRH
jgi:hypothetical protein